MVTLTLPRLVAGRDLAAAAVSRLGSVTGADVAVDARALTSGTGSFAGQLVRSIIVDGQAEHLHLLGGPADFADDVRSAAANLHVTARVSVESGEIALLDAS